MEYTIGIRKTAATSLPPLIRGAFAAIAPAVKIFEIVGKEGEWLVVRYGTNSTRSEYERLNDEYGLWGRD